MDRAFENRILAVQRDLIEAAGGIKRVGELSGYSKTEVGRWNGGVGQEVMPLMIVALLERDCKRPLISTVMAEVTGRRLTDPEDEIAVTACILTAFSEKAMADAELQLEVAQDMADGIFTHAEMARADRKAAVAQDKLNDFRAALAGGKAVTGGVKTGIRLVSGE